MKYLILALAILMLTVSAACAQCPGGRCPGRGGYGYAQPQYRYSAPVVRYYSAPVYTAPPTIVYRSAPYRASRSSRGPSWSFGWGFLRSNGGGGYSTIRR